MDSEIRQTSIEFAVKSYSGNSVNTTDLLDRAKEIYSFLMDVSDSERPKYIPDKE